MITTSRVTVDQLERMGNQDGKFELIDGEVRSVASGYNAGELALYLGTVLNLWSWRNDLGKVLGADTSFVIDRVGGTVLVPDVSYLRPGREPKAEDGWKFFDGAPDLAVEVRSPSNSSASLRDKMRRYLDAGTELGWMVDGLTETVTIWAPNDPPRVLGGDAELSDGSLLPNFRLPLTALFARDRSVFGTIM